MRRVATVTIYMRKEIGIFSSQQSGVILLERPDNRKREGSESSKVVKTVVIERSKGISGFRLKFLLLGSKKYILLG